MHFIYFRACLPQIKFPQLEHLVVLLSFYLLHRTHWLIFRSLWLRFRRGGRWGRVTQRHSKRSEIFFDAGSHCLFEICAWSSWYPTFMKLRSESARFSLRCWSIQFNRCTMTDAFSKPMPTKPENISMWPTRLFSISCIHANHIVYAVNTRLSKIVAQNNFSQSKFCTFGRSVHSWLYQYKFFAFFPKRLQNL